MEDREQASRRFTQPTAVDRLFNRAFGLLVRLGLGMRHNYLLEVRGRKSGRKYSTPVNLLELDGKKYLVAPRGYTQWVRNVIASGEGTLVRGLKQRAVYLKPIADEVKPPILKSYLDSYKTTVQRYFPVQAGSPLEAFEPLAASYPVFAVTDKP